MKKQGAAYYARRGSRVADFWTVLHPPYTAWHLAYVAVGSALVPVINWPKLAIMLLAFFCGTGIAAHVLDELNGRPLQTGFSARELKIMAAGSLALSLVLAMILVELTSPLILLFYGVGVFFVLAYNLEWFNGLFHTDICFGLFWGAFPLLVGYWTQAGTVTPAVLISAGAALLLSLAQRSLSTPARFVRRKTEVGKAVFTVADDSVFWEKEMLLDTWERPLRLLSWFIVLLAISLLITKL
jgi:hypothetical protein